MTNKETCKHCKTLWPSRVCAHLTADQPLAPQIDALKAGGCGKIFEDCVSGAKMDRPGLNEALDPLRSGGMLLDTVCDLEQCSILNLKTD